VFAAAACLATAAHATTYYVDIVAGSDSNAGTSAAAAWKTLTKVNGKTFAAGDQILFHAGQTWSGQLHPLGSGAVGSPITVSGYSTGAMPIVDGSSLSGGGAVYLYNQSYWTIDGLEITSNSGVNNVGTLATPGVNRSGILVDNEGGMNLLKGITIQNNYVHDVNGCFQCNGVNPQGNGGIVFLADPTSTLSWGTDSYGDIVISNNLVDHVGRTGIVFWDNSTGLLFALDPSALSNNVTIHGNQVYNVDSDGIILAGAKNSIMDHNVVGVAGLVTVAGSGEPSAVGLWPAKTYYVTVEYNEVYGVHTAQGVDGEGYDVDLAAQYTTVQYNYSHDNEGGFMLMEGGFGHGINATIRYNLSVNDGYSGQHGIFTFAYGVIPNTSIYNNTIYVASGLPTNLTSCDGTPSWDKSTSETMQVQNNIIANFGSGGYVSPTGSGISVDHNLFYGNHPSSEPVDAYKIVSDPLFVSASAIAPTGFGAVTGYQVSAGSPAIGSGAVISGNGGLDYFSRPVSATFAPTRGFYEASSF
jgi:hypothetical protein